MYESSETNSEYCTGCNGYIYEGIDGFNVCSNCGLVNSTCHLNELNQDNAITYYDSLRDICDRIHLTRDIESSARYILHSLSPFYIIDSDSKVGYSIYKACIDHKVPRLPEEVEWHCNLQKGSINKVAKLVGQPLIMNDTLDYLRVFVSRMGLPHSYIRKAHRILLSLDAYLNFRKTSTACAVSIYILEAAFVSKGRSQILKLDLLWNVCGVREHTVLSIIEDLKKKGRVTNIKKLG